jgi:hypothetical protein
VFSNSKAGLLCPKHLETNMRTNMKLPHAHAAAAGGMAEYEAVSSFMAELDSRIWVSSETRLLNRNTAPRLLLSHRLANRTADRWRPNVAFAEAPQT